MSDDQQPERVIVPAPPTLNDAGSELWDRLVAKYDFRPDELDTLEDICQITDVVAELEAAWDDTGRSKLTKGSMGQEVIHPIVGEIRAQRMSKNALWRQLKIPDEPAGAAANQHRSAANSKWASRPSSG